MIRLYDLASRLAGPLLPLWLAIRRRRGLEDSDRAGERRGVAAMPRPEGGLVWFHGASIGETSSVLPLIAWLRRERPDTAILVTSGTVSSALVLHQRLPDGVIHQYIPLDRRAWAERFLDHWRPDLTLWIESDLWPNMLGAIGRRGLPAVLVNARMSERSFRRWRRLPGAARRLLGAFRAILAQDAENARRFEALAGRPVAVAGNLKYAAAPLEADEALLADLAETVAGRPVWLAASTHPGEEAVVADAHQALRQRHAGVLTLLLPRHPARGDEIEALMARKGLRVARRSRDEEPGAATEIYLVDTFGEAGLFYRLAGIAFIGGTLVPHGGQNPLEAARLGAAILHGPGMANFAEIAAELGRAGGSRTVADGAELVEGVSALIADPEARAGQARRALGVANARGEVLERVIAALRPHLG